MNYLSYASEEDIRSEIRRSLVVSRPLKEQLILEGLGQDALKDGVQFLVGAAAEYGLGAITLPAAGAGLAVGPTVETSLDSLFAAESVASTVAAIANISSMAGDFEGMIRDAIAAYDVRNLGNYYNHLRKVVKEGLKMAGKSAIKAADDFVEKLKGVVEEIIQNITGAIKDGIKLVIPDATIGTAVATAFGELLEKVSENAYSIAKTIIGKSDMLMDFLADPGVARDFFEDLFGQVIKLMREGAKKIEDASFLEKAAAVSGVTAVTVGGGLIPAVALATLGPTGLEKGADMFESALPGLLKTVESILKVVIPTAITALGIYQILMKEEYKDKPKKKLKGEGVMRTTRKQLRQVIREAILVEEESKAGVFGSGMEKADLDKEKDELVGHT
tara:strand:+ start:1566 stop:2732 length:1167 start_codon:yes stop_codon:yes gene_type:complete